MKFLRGLLMMLAMGLWSVTAMALDEMDWNPPVERPALRRHFTDEIAFALRLADVRADIDLDAMQKSKEPILGFKVLMAVEEMQAHKLGIRIGETLTEVDGVPMRWDWQFGKGREDGVVYTFTVVGVDGASRTVTTTPGLLGIRTNSAYPFDQIYLHTQKRDPRWDEWMMLGTAVLKTDAHLAEECLRRSIEAGLPINGFTDIMAAEIYRLQNRHGIAMSFAHLAMEADYDLSYTAGVFYQSALSAFKIRDALAINQKYYPHRSDVIDRLEKLIAEFESLPQAQRDAPAPSIYVQEETRRDLIPKLRPLSPATSYYLKQLVEGRAMRFAVPHENFRSLVYGPAIESGAVEFRFRQKPSSLGSTAFAKVFMVGFFDQANPMYTRRLYDGMPNDSAIGIAMKHDGTIKSYHATNQFEITYAQPTLDPQLTDPNLQSTLKIIVHNHRVEVLLNGTRIFYGPLPTQTKKLVPYFKNVGMTVELEDVQIVEFLNPVVQRNN